jgi:serine/threonine-protein kinase
MTTDQMQRVDALFEAAIRLDPPARDGWLRAACSGDADLLTLLRRLVAQDERAEENGFLSPPETANAEREETAAWEPAAQNEARGPSHPATTEKPERDSGLSPFKPQAAIWAALHSEPSSAAPQMAQTRLARLTITYLLITCLMICWKIWIVQDTVFRQIAPYLLLLVALVGVGLFLRRRTALSGATLRALELGMIAFFAGVFAFAQYEAMLEFSLRGDPERAELVMNHRILITTVLILTYGVYAPVSWRRVALVVGTIAILPFATCVLLYLRHPQAMAWLACPCSDHAATVFALFGFDAMLLLILAAGSAYGAHAMSRMRTQVREARQLGQYRLGERLGAGGMGEVYLAEHQFLKRPCALKLLRHELDSSPKSLARFEREVRLTATLSHPNTVEIYDYGRTEDGTYYYVMEYLPGLSLDELVKRYGPLPPGRVVYLLRQVCSALHEAHGAGLVHRDIKPSNIFASRRGAQDDVAKLLDFGLVRATAKSSDANLSDDGQILGTPLFMSPEQALGGRELDGRSDIYSLGAVAYFLLTGQPPFDKKGTIEALVAVARDPVVFPSVLRDGIPSDLEAVLMKCLDREPSNRYPDAESLEEELSELACAKDWTPRHAAEWWRRVEVKRMSA